MESLLTPVVNRLLRRFIKSADGQTGSGLRATFAGGSLVLHDLELNLDPLVGDLPVRVHRAFARELRLDIPWRSLGSQPLEIRLETVECILALHSPEEAASAAARRAKGAAAEAAAAAEGDDGSGGGSSWLGSFLQQALSNIRVVVSNMVLKYIAPTATATFTCKHVRLFSAEDDWQSRLIEPEAWVKMSCEIARATICLDDNSSSAGGPMLFQEPLLRCSIIKLSLLAPLLVLLHQGSAVHVSLADLMQVEWLQSFVNSLPAAFRKDAAHLEGDRRHQDGPAQCLGPGAVTDTPDDSSEEGIEYGDGGAVSSGFSWLMSGAGSALGSAWEFMTDEATAAQSAGDREANLEAARLAAGPMEVVVTLSLKGVELAGRCVDHDKYERRRRALSRNLSMTSPSKASGGSRLGGAIERHMRASAGEGSAAGPSGQQADAQAPAQRAPIGAKYSLPPEFDLDEAGPEVGRAPAGGVQATGEDFLEVPFLCLSLQGLDSRLHYSTHDLLVDVALRSVSLRRPVCSCAISQPPDGPEGATQAGGGAGPVQDEVLGLHHPPAGALPSSLLSNGPLGPDSRPALRLKWRRFLVPDGEDDAAPANGARHTLAIAAGLLGVAYAPGVTATLCRFLCVGSGATARGSEPKLEPHGSKQTPDALCGAAGESPHGSDISQTLQQPQKNGALTRLLEGQRLEVAFTCGFCQLAVLSTVDIDAEALTVAAHELSAVVGAYLGATASLPGLDPFGATATVSALHQAARAAAPPGGGRDQDKPAARAAAAMVLWGVAEHWVPKRKRTELTLAAGVAPVSNKLSMSCVGRLRRAGPGEDVPLSWETQLQFSAGALSLSAPQAAALRAAMSGMVAEVATGYTRAMPRRVLPSPLTEDCALSAITLSFSEGIEMAFGARCFTPGSNPGAEGSGPFGLCLREAELLLHANAPPNRQPHAFGSAALLLELRCLTLWQLEDGGGWSLTCRSAAIGCPLATSAAHSAPQLVILDELAWRRGGASPYPQQLTITRCKMQAGQPQLETLAGMALSLAVLPFMPPGAAYPASAPAAPRPESTFALDLGTGSVRLLSACGALALNCGGLRLEIELGSPVGTRLSGLVVEDGQLTWQDSASAHPEVLLGAAVPSAAPLVRIDKADGDEGGGGWHSLLEVGAPLSASVSPDPLAALAALGSQIARLPRWLELMTVAEASAAPEAAPTPASPCSIRLALPGLALHTSASGASLTLSTGKVTGLLRSGIAGGVAGGLPPLTGHRVAVSVWLGGVAARLEGPGFLPPGGHALLAPADVSLELASAASPLSRSRKSLSARLDAEELRVALSPGCAAAMAALAAALASAATSACTQLDARPVGSIALAAASVRQGDASRAVPRPPSTNGWQPPDEDDLRSSAFTFCSRALARPARLQVVFSVRQPEGAPAQHQHWVGWRYKAPRPVLHIVLSLPRAAATCPALHLQYYNTEQQTFVTVASAGPNALVAGQLGMRPRQEHPATAEEWRLCWSSRAEPGAGALPPCGRELLACLWVNPAQLAGASGLPPLRVPLAAAASVRRLRVGLLLEHSAPDGPRWEQLDVGALYGGELQLLGQAFPQRRAYTAAVAGEVAAYFCDNTTLTEQVLVDSFRFGCSASACLDPNTPPQPGNQQLRGPARDAPFLCSAPRADHAAAYEVGKAAVAGVALSLEDGALLDALPCPTRYGASLAASAGGQGIAVRASQRAVEEMSRVAPLWAAFQAARSAKGASHQGHVATQIGDGLAVRRFEAIHGGGILVENLCPVAIAIGQVGAAAGAGALLLSAGARQAFLLPAIPEHCPSATRQLRVASSAEALAAAVRGADGCVSSGSGWLHPGQDGPFAVTSGAAYQRPLTWPNGLQACVTIQVYRRKSGQLCCCVRPMHRVVNNTRQELRVQYQGALPSATRRAAAAGPHPRGEIELRLEAGQSTDLLLLEAAPALMPRKLSEGLGPLDPNDGVPQGDYWDEQPAKPAERGELRVALAQRSSWSTPLPFTPEGLSSRNVMLPCTAPAPPQAIICHLDRPSPLLQAPASARAASAAGIGAMGQAAVGFWPQVVFKNCLPEGIEVAVIRATWDGKQRGATTHSSCDVPADCVAPLEMPTMQSACVAFRMGGGGGEGWSHPVSMGSQALAHRDAGTGVLELPAMTDASQPQWRVEAVPQLELGKPLVVSLPSSALEDGTDRKLSSVQCTLVAHWGLASPSVELALYPVAILRNELPYAMDVVARKGGCLATAPPHGTVLLDWTAADSRNEGAGGPVVPPSWVYIRPHSPAGCSNRGMIRLQDGHCALLTLWQQLEGCGAEVCATQSEPRHQCHMVAANVQTTLRDAGASQTAVHVSSVSGKQQVHLPQVVQISLRPGAVVTNLCPWPLCLRPSGSGSPLEGLVAGAVVAAKGGGIEVAPQQSASFESLWVAEGEVPTTPRMPAGSASEPSLHRAGSFNLPPPAPAPPGFGVTFALLGGDGAPEAEDCWSPCVRISRASCQRGRCLVRMPGSAAPQALLSWKLSVVSRGQTHLVVFLDSQPPVALSNLTGSRLWVGMAAGVRSASGGVVYSPPEAADTVEVGAGERVEWAANESAQLWAGLPPEAATLEELLLSREADGRPPAGEDEEMLLDVLTRGGDADARGSAQRAAAPPLLQLKAWRGGRPAGGGADAARSDAWKDSHICCLQEGRHAAGGLQARATQSAHLTSRPPATSAARPPSDRSCAPSPHPGLQVTISRLASTWHVAVMDTTPPPEAMMVAPPPPLPLQLAVTCDLLQVSLWDDKGLSAADQSNERPQLTGTAAELAALTFGKSVVFVSLDTSWVHCHSSGSNAMAVRSGTCHIGCRSLQLDSYLKGSVCPVILASLQDAPPAASLSMPCSAHRGASSVRAVDLPLLISFTLCHQAERAGSEVHRAARHAAPLGLGLPLDRVWVQQLHAKLPKMLAAVDDSAAVLLAALQRLAVVGDRKDGMPTGSQAQEEPGASLASFTAEARLIAAPRLLIERLEVAQITLLADMHLSGTSALVPIRVDTRQSPVQLSRIHLHNAMYRPGVLARGFSAHVMAEAMLSAPLMVGSLELLFNPTGLLSSVSAGVYDLLAMPLAGLESRSATAFLLGVGAGSVSLISHLSGWTLTSISGFSTAFARVLEMAVSSRRPGFYGSSRSLGQGLSRGLGALAGGVVGGLMGVIREPVAGYSRAGGVGVLGGVGRGLLGVVGLPLSGALEAVGALSSGIAGSVGVGEATSRAPVAMARQTAPGDVLVGAPRLMRTLPQAVMRRLENNDAAAPYLGHARATSIDVERPGQSRRELSGGAMLLLAGGALVAVSTDTSPPACVIAPLADVELLGEDFRSRRITLRCATASVDGINDNYTPADGGPIELQLRVVVDPADWDSWMPLARRCFRPAMEIV
eukprot:jgi/Tetstr1/456571/TSEL_043291.t2